METPVHIFLPIKSGKCWILLSTYCTLAEQQWIPSGAHSYLPSNHWAKSQHGNKTSNMLQILQFCEFCDSAKKSYYALNKSSKKPTLLLYTLILVFLDFQHSIHRGSTMPHTLSMFCRKSYLKALMIPIGDRPSIRYCTHDPAISAIDIGEEKKERQVSNPHRS